jgi:hypothetical protein
VHYNSFHNGATCEESLMCIGTFSMVTEYKNTTFRKQTASVFRWTTIFRISNKLKEPKTYKFVCIQTSKYKNIVYNIRSGHSQQVAVILEMSDSDGRGAPNILRHFMFFLSPSRQRRDVAPSRATVAVFYPRHFAIQPLDDTSESGAS